MKTSIILVGLMTIMSLLTSASFSDPTSQGPTGIMNVPTAEVVPNGMFEMSLAYDSYKVGDVRVKTFPAATLSYGFKRGEIGVSYFNFTNNGVESVKSANVKYMLSPENRDSPNFAVGVMYASGNVAETDVYLVATDTLGLGGHISTTAGVLYQQPNYTGASAHCTGMLGMTFGSTRHTNLGIDYIMHDIAAGSMVGVTIRQPISSTIGVQVGMGNASRYFAGITLKFGGK